MVTPAERIYDTAAAALEAQQSRADQITSTVGPIGAGAAAAALLLKPALHDFGHAQITQILGFGLGIFGIATVLIGCIALLRRPDLPGVTAADLLEVASGPPVLVGDGDAFHFAATPKLVQAWKRDRAGPLATHEARFTAVAIALVLEVAGLSVAAEIQPRPNVRPHAAPRLTVAESKLDAGGLHLTGRLTPTASGVVRVQVTFTGRGRKTVVRMARLRAARFTVLVSAPHAVRPARAASYRVAWRLERLISSARIAGDVGVR